MKSKGSLVVLSGPSGVGKSTLLHRVMPEFPDFEFSVSCTTRAPRNGEVNGRDYTFLSFDEFDGLSRSGGFLEEAVIFANRYGTPKREVVDRLRSGRSVILDIDIQGARQIRKSAAADPELAASSVFVMSVPPSFESLEQRLRGRNTETAEQLALRIGAARRELSGFREYDYLVVNDDIDRATADLAALFRSFALRSALVTGDLL
ncbi:MAG: guanylate kinase [Victivallaceae bacterium]|nr:guanylate kinase [Victivallaceae bacterium]